MDVVLRAVDLPELAPMWAALSQEMVERYGGGEGAGPLDTSAFEAPPGVLLAAGLDGRLVGCGGLRVYAPGTGEIKRMYVAPAARGHGVARVLLRALLAAARDGGLLRVILETGTQQPEAIALYVSAGFTPIEPYGHFKAEPLSRCYALEL